MPSTNDTLKAVVALIHPGGLLWGSPDSSQHGSPHFVMNRDVVYVTIGYRINIFGIVLVIFSSVLLFEKKSIGTGVTLIGNFIVRRILKFRNERMLG